MATEVLNHNHVVSTTTWWITWWIHVDYDLNDDNMNRNVIFLKAMLRPEAKNKNHENTETLVLIPYMVMLNI